MARSTGSRCAFCRARSTGILCGLGSATRTRVERDKAIHIFRRGQPIFFTGAPVQALYVVRSGRVKVFRAGPGGEEQVIRLLGPGELLGYRPLLANESYRASAEAVEEASICIIPATTVRELLRADPDFALHLLEKLARELRLSEDLMMNLLHRPVRERAAHLLLLLLEDSRGTPEGPLLHSKHLHRQDMARMIGTTPETFSRVLRGFSQRGIITLTRDHIRVRDEAQLRQIAGDGLSD